MKHLIVVTTTLYLAASQAALAAGKDWYPKADDLCAEYVTKMLKDGELFTIDRVPTKDPAIARYVSDFNAATGKNDKPLALFVLLSYCRRHAAEKLADVSAQAAIADFNANKLTSKTQLSPADTSAVDNWYNNALKTCGSDGECQRIAKKTYDDSIACIGGDTKACSNRDNDLVDIGRWNAEHRAAQALPQETLMQCLQRSAQLTIKSCRDTGCDSSLLYDMIGITQKTLCGYSAIEPVQSSPLNPNLTSCITSPGPGGGWITTCTQF